MAQFRAVWRVSTGKSAPQAIQQVLAPGLRLGDLVEREDVQPLDQRGRLAQGGCALLEEPLAGEAAGRGQPREGALMLVEEPGRLADSDLRRHGQQLRPVDRAR